MIFFIDTSYSNINLALFKDNGIISSKRIHTNRNMTEILIDEIKVFLYENKISNIDIPNKIKSIYIVSGPGSFTSIKLESVFVNLLKCFFEKINIFSIDSCSIQRDKERCICVVDSRGNKSYAKLFLKKIESKIIIINNDNLKLFSEKYKIPIIDSINDYNIQECFIKNKDHFKKVERVIPNYVKKAI